MERLHARVDAHLAQPFALILQAHHVGTIVLRDLLQQLEIDMRGNVRIPGMGEDIDLLVRLQRLHRRARAQLHVAVIDHQRGPALFAQAPGDLGHQRDARRAGLDHRALRGAAPTRGHEMIHPLVAGDEGESLAVEPYQTIVPSHRRTHQLMHRQGIEELVGDDQQRRIVGQGREIVVVVTARKGLALERAQRGGGLDEVDLRHQIVTRRRAQRVLRQRPAPGPQLDIVDALAATHPHPQIREPQADQFAEHLADFGCRDKIALLAKGIAAGVVARVALADKLRKADRACLADQTAQGGGDVDFGAGAHFGFEPRLLRGGGFFGLAFGLFFSRKAGSFFRRQPCRFLRSEPRSLRSGGFRGLTAGLFFGSLARRILGFPTGALLCFGFGTRFRLAAGLFGSRSLRAGFRFGLGPSLGLGFGTSAGFGLGFLAGFFLGAGARRGFSLRTGAGFGFGQLLRASFGGCLLARLTLRTGAGLGLGLLAGSLFLGEPGSLGGFGPGPRKCLGLGLRGSFGPDARFGAGLGPCGSLRRGARLRITAGKRRGILVAGGIDQPELAAPDPRSTAAQAGAVVPAASGFFRSAEITTINPIRISGMVSHWPIDSPVRAAKSASC